MVVRSAVRSIAVLFVLLSPVLDGRVTAFAQDQVDVGALEPAEPSRRAPAAAEPFGLDVFPVTSGEVLDKWSGVVADIRAENEVLARCRGEVEPCPPAAQELLARHRRRPRA